MLKDRRKKHNFTKRSRENDFRENIEKGTWFSSKGCQKNVFFHQKIAGKYIIGRYLPPSFCCNVSGLHMKMLITSFLSVIPKKEKLTYEKYIDVFCISIFYFVPIFRIFHPESQLLLIKCKFNFCKMCYFFYGWAIYKTPSLTAYSLYRSSVKRYNNF